MSIDVMKRALESLGNLAWYADTCELFIKETHPGKAAALHQRVTDAIETIAVLRGAIEEAESAEPVMHDENLLEQLYWEFDANRKKSGEERLSFKGFMRAYGTRCVDIGWGRK